MTTTNQTKREMIIKATALIKKNFKFYPFHISLNSMSKDRLKEFIKLYEVSE